MGRDGEFVGVFFELSIDPFLHTVEIFAGHRLAATKFFGETHRAEIGGVDRLNLFAGGEDDFGAATADVGEQGIFAGQIEAPPDAVEGEVGFFFGADHFDRQVELLGDPLAEIGAISRFTDGAGGDRVEAFDA